MARFKTAVGVIWCFLCVCFLCLLLIAPRLLPPAIAQETTGANQPELSTEQALQPIPAHQIVSELESHQQIIEKINSLFERAAIEKWNSTIADLRTRVDSKKLQVKELDSANESRLSLERLAELQEPLLAFGSEIDKHISQLKSLSADLVLELNKLDQRKLRWELTNKNLEADQITRPQANRIPDVLQQIEQAAIEARKKFNQLLLQENELSNLSIAVRSALARVNELQAQLRSSLFERDQSSVYTKAFWQEFNQTRLSNVLSNLDTRWQEVTDYFERSVNRILFHGLLFLAIAVFVFRLKNSEFVKLAFPKLGDNPGLLIVTATVLASLAIYPDASSSIKGFVGLFMVIPLVLFFRDILDYRFTSIISGIGLLYVADQARFLVGENTRISELILLISMFGAAWLSRMVYIKAIRSIADPANEHPRRAALCRQIGRLGIFVFSLLGLLVSFGFYHLAIFVGDGVFYLIYSGLVLLAVYRILGGFSVGLLHSRIFNKIRFVSLYRKQIESNIDLLLVFSLMCLWIHRVLVRIDLMEDFKDSIRAVLRAGVSFGEFELRLGSLLAAVLVLFLGFKLARILVLFLDSDVYARRRVDFGLRNTIDTIIRYLIVAVAILSATSALGIDFQNIAIIAGALSVGIGFGMQNIVNNFVSGLILLFERPIKVGDLVRIGDAYGNVTRIGIRASTIRTLDEAEIIVPNATLVAESVVNLTFTNSLARLSVKVGVAYGTDISQCMSVLEQAVKSHPEVMESPAVQVLFNEFGDSSLNFEVRAWIADAQQRQRYQSDLHVAISNALSEAGIKIPFPQRDVHMITPKAANS